MSELVGLVDTDWSGGMRNAALDFAKTVEENGPGSYKGGWKLGKEMADFPVRLNGVEGKPSKAALYSLEHRGKKVTVTASLKEDINGHLQPDEVLEVDYHDKSHPGDLIVPYYRTDPSSGLDIKQIYPEIIVSELYAQGKLTSDQQLKDITGRIAMLGKFSKEISDEEQVLEKEPIGDRLKKEALPFVSAGVVITSLMSGCDSLPARTPLPQATHQVEAKTVATREVVRQSDPVKPVAATKSNPVVAEPAAIPQVQAPAENPTVQPTEAPAHQWMIWDVNQINTLNRIGAYFYQDRGGRTLGVGQMDMNQFQGFNIPANEIYDFSRNGCGTAAAVEAYKMVYFWKYGQIPDLKMGKIMQDYRDKTYDVDGKQYSFYAPDKTMFVRPLTQILTDLDPNNDLYQVINIPGSDLGYDKDVSINSPKNLTEFGKSLNEMVFSKGGIATGMIRKYGTNHIVDFTSWDGSVNGEDPTVTLIDSYTNGGKGGVYTGPLSGYVENWNPGGVNIMQVFGVVPTIQ